MANDEGQRNEEQDLVVRAERAGSAVTLKLTGELDASSTSTLHDALHDALEGGNPVDAIKLDLEGLRFCDSRGIAALIVIWNGARSDGRSFGLVNPSEAVRRVLQITGLEQTVPID